MKRIFALLFVLCLLLCSCTETEPSQPNTESGDDAADNTQGIREDESVDTGYKDIAFVDIGPLVTYDLTFEGCAVETVLPKGWEFKATDTGVYTLYRAGKLIGTAVSGEADLDGWKVLEEDLYETETGVVINTFIDKNLSDGAYRRRLYFSLVDQPWAGATVSVSYEQLDMSTMYRIWRESKVSAVKNTPNFGELWEVEEDTTVLILGNSFISSSRIGAILNEMCVHAPYRISVQAISRGYAQVGTYTSDTAIMKGIRSGLYGCVFICGFYSANEVDNLRTLQAACDESNTPLVIFPAHNESASVISAALASDDSIYYIPWRDEVETFITLLGVDKWDMCINDMHKHSTPLAGYVGAHMIYRALFDEVPPTVSVVDVIDAETVKETLGEAYLLTGVITQNERVLVFP